MRSRVKATQRNEIQATRRGLLAWRALQSSSNAVRALKRRFDLEIITLSETMFSHVGTTLVFRNQAPRRGLLALRASYQIQAMRRGLLALRDLHLPNKAFRALKRRWRLILKRRDIDAEPALNSPSKLGCVSYSSYALGVGRVAR